MKRPPACRPRIVRSHDFPGFGHPDTRTSDQGPHTLEPSWLRRFLLDLAGDDRDPNRDIRIVLPVAAESFFGAGQAL